ncbi:MAG TPA: AmmeMemoRadiSam system radical SAM enzyme [Methanothrix sp.]|nr:AmmeMemoRadiSam system radical SAM enzyme [Methanothrix sp.]HQE87913.1 AmmeMemoRadiSam system radical SAM enzyme [Methanothrix sp.]
MSAQTVKEAQFWEGLDEGNVLCRLCHHECRIRPGKRGLCGVRENQQGRLMTLVYGNVVAANADPIEKKPLFHFQPGSLSYSIATAGCNFRCLHCQNSEISQSPRETGRIPGEFMPPREVVEQALLLGCSSISCTYTEPTVFLEYALDVSAAARSSGLKNVFVSNGYMGEEAVERIAPLLDAINIDLKGDDQFYRRVCSAKLEPVQHNIEQFWRKGVWVEVTTLIIPGYNDSQQVLGDIAQFLAGISPDMPWHVSAFYPMYRMKDVPRTGIESLRRGLSAGRLAGLKHVYAGNIPGESENTLCPSCGELLIERLGYRIIRDSLRDGRCPRCHTAVAGVWS